MSTVFSREFPDAKTAFGENPDRKAEDALFPAPLTVFEEYMFLDDSTAYPMDIFRRFRFVGRLDVDALRTAVERAVERHSLFSCRVEKRGRRFFWVPTDAPIAFQAFRREIFVAKNGENSSENGADSAFLADVRPLSLSREPGLRTTVVWDDSSADVVFQSHHCVADGSGTGRFLRDVLCEYALLVGGAPTETRLPEIDATVLRRRGDFGLTAKRYFLNAYYTTRSTRRFLFVKARPFAAERRFDVKNFASDAVLNDEIGATSVVRNRVDLIAATLTIAASRLCFDAAKKNGATVNDFLLTRFCEALDRLRRRGGLPIRGVDRIAVPVDMRNENHLNAPACNVVTMAFLHLPTRIRRDSPRLLREIRRQTIEIKRREQKHFLNLTLKTGRFLAATFGSDLSFFLKSRACRATATVSNLGRTLLDVPLARTPDGRVEINGLLLDSDEVFSPIRAGSVVSIAASTYANRLRFGLRYDPSFLSPKEAAEFLDDFCASLAADR